MRKPRTTAGRASHDRPFFLLPGALGFGGEGPLSQGVRPITYATDQAWRSLRPASGGQGLFRGPISLLGGVPGDGAAIRTADAMRQAGSAAAAKPPPRVKRLPATTESRLRRGTKGPWSIRGELRERISSTAPSESWLPGKNGNTPCDSVQILTRLSGGSVIEWRPAARSNSACWDPLKMRRMRPKRCARRSFFLRKEPILHD